MRYKAVLFDMDGTVLNSIGDITDSVNAALTHFGYPQRTEAEVTSFVGNGALRLMELCLPVGTCPERLQEVLSWYKVWYNNHSCIRTAPYPGILSLMERLRDKEIVTAIISNKPDSTVAALDDLFFKGYTDYRLGEAPSLERKPAPDMIFRCMEILGLSPAECVYVGDTEVDLLTAKNAGIPCLTVGWGYRSAAQLRAAGAEQVFSTADALGDYILS